MRGCCRCFPCARSIVTPTLPRRQTSRARIELFFSWFPRSKRLLCFLCEQRSLLLHKHAPCTLAHPEIWMNIRPIFSPPSYRGKKGLGCEGVGASYAKLLLRGNTQPHHKQLIYLRAVSFLVCIKTVLLGCWMPESSEDIFPAGAAVTSDVRMQSVDI